MNPTLDAYEGHLKNSWTGGSAPLLCRRKHNSGALPPVHELFKWPSYDWGIPNSTEKKKAKTETKNRTANNNMGNSESIFLHYFTSLILVLYNHHYISTALIFLSNDMVGNEDLETMWKPSWPILRYYNRICLEGLRIRRKILSLDGLFACWDSNPREWYPHNHDTLHPGCSVKQWPNPKRRLISWIILSLKQFLTSSHARLSYTAKSRAFRNLTNRLYTTHVQYFISGGVGKCWDIIIIS